MVETLLLLSLCMPELGGGDCPPGGREPSAPEPGGRHKRPSVSGGGGKRQGEGMETRGEKQPQHEGLTCHCKARGSATPA